MHRRVEHYRMMVAAATLALSVACSEGAPASHFPADSLASWSNVRVTEGDDPHAYGTSIDLWRRNGEIIGFVSVYGGPVADPPAGKLEQIVYDETTGSLSFSAKLSLGVTQSAEGAWVATRDQLVFNGVIEPTAMRGVLRKDFIRPNDSSATLIPGVVDTVVLAMVRDSVQANRPTFEQWVETWTFILKVRGPKW